MPLTDEVRAPIHRQERSVDLGEPLREKEEEVVLPADAGDGHFGLANHVASAANDEVPLASERLERLWQFDVPVRGDVGRGDD
jgi:hypothetical protein